MTTPRTHRTGEQGRVGRGRRLGRSALARGASIDAPPLCLTAMIGDTRRGDPGTAPDAR
jgi:hypothetical protein